MKSYFFRILIFLILTAGAKPFVQAQVEEPLTVVAVFGDSITVGENNENRRLRRVLGDGRTDLGLGVGLVSPDMLVSELLNTSNRPSVVVNWGAGGSPSGPSLNPGLEAFTNGLERISSNLIQTKNEHVGDAYYVLILYGTNDPNWSIDASTTGFNIVQMIDKARSAGYVPVIGSVPPLGLSQTYNSRIRSAASTRSAPLVDIYAVFKGNSGLFDPDGVHPTNTGYQLIAQKWFDDYLDGAIEPVLDPIMAPIIMLLLGE